MGMSNAKSITEALVIVDMQDDFLDNAADDACVLLLVNNIIREVKAAREKRIPIICLTYANQEDGFDSPKESWEYHATVPRYPQRPQGLLPCLSRSKGR